MATINPTLPTVGDPNATADPAIKSAIQTIVTLVNGNVDATNIAANTVVAGVVNGSALNQTLNGTPTVIGGLTTAVTVARQSIIVFGATASFLTTGTSDGIVALYLNGVSTVRFTVVSAAASASLAATVFAAPTVAAGTHTIAAFGSTGGTCTAQRPYSQLFWVAVPA